MSKAESRPPISGTQSDKVITYTRFELSQRIEHIVFLVSFSLLGLTGLVQKYADMAFSQWFFRVIGGIENTRQVHHAAAVVMMFVSAYHILVVLYKVFVLRVKWSMVPVIEDARHVVQDIAYFIGLRKHRAYYDRYNYAEKMEYLAVVWGTLLMGLTGFMMWNPITTAHLLPGQIIPAAKAAHGAEAILAVLAIIIWHFYHVHLRTFNKSMFTGKLTREEMRHEHPAELATIESGEIDKRPPLKVIRQRQKIYFPIAAILTVVFGFGIYYFLNVETTAIATTPEGETAEVFVPITPTPRPTPMPTQTPEPGAPVGEMTWDGYFSGLFDNRCGTCHGITSVGGLSLATYEDALAGGNSGPGIVPGDPDNSTIVQVQSAGGHPGQLTIEELNQTIEWILAGAPEQ
jgi:cytochrome b subunit of formate dehydrogenase